MPTVPTLRGPQVQQNSMPVVAMPQSAVARNTGDISSAFGKLGDAAYQVALQEQQRANEIQYQDWKNEYYQYENTTLAGKDGYLSTMTGKKAFDVPGLVANDLDEIRKRQGEQARNRTQHDMLDQLSNEWSSRINRLTSGFVVDQSEQYDKQSTNAIISSASDSAARSYVDPVKRQEAVDDGVRTIMAQAARFGESDESRDLRILSFKSSAYRNMIDSALADNNYASANALYDEYKDEMLASDKVSISDDIDRAKSAYENSVIANARADVDESIVAGDLGETERKIKEYSKTLPRGEITRMTKQFNEAIENKRDESRSLRAEQLISTLRSNPTPDVVADIKSKLDEGTKLFASNPLADNAFTVSQQTAIKNAIDAAEKQDSAVSQIERRFAGDYRVPMPQDPDSIDAYAKKLAQSGMSNAQIIRKFVDNGESVPQWSVTQIDRQFSEASLDIAGGLASLAELHPQEASRVIASLKNNSDMAYVAYNSMRGLDPSSQEYADNLAVLQKPTARASFSMAGTLLLGRDAKINRATLINSEEKLRPSIMTEDARNLFDATFMLNTAKMGIPPDGDFNKLFEIAGKDTVKQLSNRLTVVKMRDESLGDPGDVSSVNVMVLSDGLHLGGIGDPESIGSDAFYEEFYKPISKRFGFFDIPWTIYNDYIGVARFDLAFTAKGDKDKTIPVVSNGNILGFVKWDGKTMQVFDEDKSATKFNALKKEMSSPAIRRALTKDPALQWSNKYSSKKLLKIQDGPEKERLKEYVTDKAKQMYFDRNGSNPDLNLLQDRQRLNEYIMRLLTENDWDGIK